MCYCYYGDLELKQVNLKDVEKRTYMSYHQDGIIDIFIGIYVLAFAAGILLNTIFEFNLWFIFPGILPALLIPVWISLKKQITVPRIGYVKFKAAGANKITAMFVGLMVAGLGMFFVFAMVSPQGWTLTLRELIITNGMLFIGAGVLLVTSLFGFILGLSRLYGYGLLAMVLFAAAHFIVLPFEGIMVALGATILGCGFVLLWRFTQKYPLTPGE